MVQNGLNIVASRQQSYMYVDFKWADVQTFYFVTGWCMDRSIQFKTAQVDKYISSCLVVMSLPSTFRLKNELVQTSWVCRPVCIPSISKALVCPEVEQQLMLESLCALVFS